MSMGPVTRALTFSELYFTTGGTVEIHTYSFTWKGGDGLFHTKYLTSASMILAKKEFEKLFGSIERLKAKVMRIE